MTDLYCISGMGVDYRLFENLDLPGCKLHFISWKTPLSGETLPDYAMRLSEAIDSSRPFALLGVSFGGMCCTEIAKHLKPVRTFIISSCKRNDELPSMIRIWRFVPLHRILNNKILISGAMLLKGKFGVRTKETGKLFNDMLRSAPDHYYRGAIDCIVRWKNTEVPQNLIHIHGDADRLIPLRHIKCDHIIKGGTHFMVMDRAEEISKIINRELSPIAELS
ncbi:MAG: alpha/beta hydrolase [Bacteroidia bacterium]